MKELIFTAHGTCELRNGKKVLWSSDGDDHFAEENPNEFLDPDEDEEMILDYLVDKDLIDDNEEIDIVEETLDDEDSDSEDEDDD